MYIDVSETQEGRSPDYADYVLASPGGKIVAEGSDPITNLNLVLEEIFSSSAAKVVSLAERNRQTGEMVEVLPNLVTSASVVSLGFNGETVQILGNGSVPLIASTSVWEIRHFLESMGRFAH